VLVTRDRGDGPAVVLLHGQPGTGASWDPVADRLVGEFRVLTPDRPGYGGTPGEATGMAANADAVAGLLRERGTGPVTLVAHSWAGGVAVLAAAGHPELVGGLVLVGAACTPDSLNALDRWLNVPGVGHALTVAGLVGIGGVLPRVRPLARYAPARHRRRLETALPDESVLGGERGALGRSRRTFMVEQRALVDELPSVVDRLGRLDLPVAVVSGGWDLVVPPRAAATLAGSIPGAELILLPEAGHFVARDDPVALADVVRRVAGTSCGRPPAGELSRPRDGARPAIG
jgi:pimeloyl-ACP methyl ester carboxylesterase